MGFPIMSLEALKRLCFINLVRLYDNTVTDADDCAELFDAEVRRVLDIHAPLRTGRRRCGQHDIRQLSDEARQAKQLLRRLERRYRRTGLESDRRAYVSACTATRDSIMKWARLTSELSLMKYPVMSAQRGELHRTYCTATERMSLVTTNARNLCRLSASSSSTK